MKQLVLIKQSSSTQLAHLYEHIFCSHIDMLFYNNHLFQYLDYSLTGRAYYSGVIYIELELYTEAAISLAQQIPTLAVQLSETTISIAASQLLAEKEAPFANTGYNNVIRALKSLHEQPWQNIDNTTLIDTKNIRRKAHPFYIAEGKSLLSRKLTTSVLLDADFGQSHRELLPLFRQFAWLITTNLQSTLADTYGYYSLKCTFKSTKQTVGLLNTFKVADAHDKDVKLSDDLVTCLKVVQDLQQYDGFTRHMAELRKISHYNHPNLAPNLERNYIDTLIFIGAKGWQKIATDENYELLLQYMSIEIQFGRKKVAAALFNN